MEKAIEFVPLPMDWATSLFDLELCSVVLEAIGPSFEISNLAVSIGFYSLVY
jgi:hypothetical protein